MSGFTGTWTMTRLFLRRDRVRMPIWIVSISVLVIASVAAFPGLYVEQGAIDARNALIMGNPFGIALTGPGHGLDEATPDNLGPVAVNEMSASTIIAMAFMGIFLVMRNTRGEEQEGRLELLRAGIVGRYAAVTAAFLLASLAALVLGVLLGVGLSGWYDIAGSFAFGLSMASVTIVFAAVGVLCAQLTEHSRAATGLATTTFAVLFTVRAIGDIRDSWVIWLSPVGWAQAIRPFADERWWTLGLTGALALALVACAFFVIERRDVGAGVLPTRKGRPRASAALASPLGLAFRLQRGALTAWTVGMFVFGATLGSLVLEGERMLEALGDAYAVYFGDVGDATLMETFLAGYLVFVAVTAAGHALQAVSQIRSEEASGHAEAQLAGSLGKGRWAASHVGAALLGNVLVLAAAGAGTGATYALAIEDASQFWPVLLAMLAYAPAVWVLVALAVALFGVVPRAFAVVWAAFAWVVVAAMIGPLLGLPEWTMDLDPFAHVPRMPAEELSVAPLLVMTGISAVLFVVGFVGFRRRGLDFG
ncbi:MAG TPA: hypothetical protein VFH17_02125 [Coriobacteriia bacterium]|nr:hypothetical protein [Coriobacteriia bacterium]